MYCIIAEKPSLAKNIATAVGAKKANGYFYNENYYITYAFGHLFELYNIEDYDDLNKGKKVKWKLSNLPCFPKKFKFNVKKDNNGKEDSGIKKQISTIKELLRDEKVTGVINAGDADREGEIIIRLIIDNCLRRKIARYRLWLPDQTDQTINAELKNLRQASDYDSLANEGFSRTYIDWLYGVNLTRFATLKTNKLLRVGRVIVPICKAIYDRDMSIRNFVVEPYFGIFSEETTNNQLIELLSKNKFDKDSLNKAKEFCNNYNNANWVCISKKTKKEIINPGKLFSLSKLQNLLGKRNKMSMEKSLAILQKLYESGYVTYPRTNSEYLATNEKSKIKSIISNIEKLGYDVCFKDKKTIFDDKKIESHSALTPTFKIPKKTDLTNDEMTVYQTIFKRFVAVFCKQDCTAEKCQIEISAEGINETFTLKGSIIITPGFTVYEPLSQKDKILPPLCKGDSINVNFKPIEKQTTPPKHYTIETLNNYLKNPFKDEKANSENDDEDYKAMFLGLELGTEATRTQIIKNAIKSGYISLNKDVYHIEKDGEFLIEQLTKLNITMDKYKTSELGKALKQVFNNQITIDDSINLACKEISNIFNAKTNYNERTKSTTTSKSNNNTTKKAEPTPPKEKAVIGTCPICGNDIVKGNFAFGCMGYKTGCKFKINFSILNKEITKANVEQLLANGKTKLIKDFTSKSGKKFSAYLVLDKEKNIVFEFENKNKPN